jgi:hypothetical protein
MNWVRNIYIVVDEQKPQWFDELKSTKMPNIHLVDIREMMDEQYIPCYNSIAIETNLHKIPGLSEYFMYFNDDMFVGCPISKKDIIRADGKIKVIPHQEKLALQYRNMSAHKYHILNMKFMLDHRFGEKERQRIQHVPLVLRKSVYEEIWREFPREIERNHTSFRDKINFHIHYFVQWYMIEKKIAIMSYLPNIVLLSKYNTVYLERCFENILQERYKLFCIQSFTDNPEKKSLYIDFIHKWSTILQS